MAMLSANRSKMACCSTQLPSMAGIIGGGSKRIEVAKEAMAVNSFKRKPEMCIHGPMEKKQRTDSSTKPIGLHKVQHGRREVQAGKIAIKGCSLLNKTVEKEHCSPSILASAASTNERQPIDSTFLRDDAAQDCASGDAPMPPKKALRAALLKKRFSDTIFKATHQKLLDNTGNLDHVKRQQERKKLEREKQEEKAKIEAQIQAAWRRSEQEDFKIRCEKERKAARMALEKIKKGVEINDNVGIFKNLEMMRCTYLYYPVDGNRIGFDGIHYGSPLEQLGLYLKDDDYVLEGEDTTFWKKKMMMRFWMGKR